MNLIIGRKYSRNADFGITGIERQWSEITVAGELFTFFSVFSGYENKIEEDGFIYEGRGPYALIPYKIQAGLHRHVFLKEEEGSYYTYLGKGKYETRYDENHNKIFW
jgi:hypothetical protein